MSIRAVICDFGGVLTSPLIGSFAKLQERFGIPASSLGEALSTIAGRDGENPLFRLERGEMKWGEFLDALADEIARSHGERPELQGFSELYFEALDPNVRMIDAMAELRTRGLRMAMLTNNVREWEPHWRSMLPVDEIFELVVDSAFVGLRKPDPRIYRLTVERLGDGIEAGQCLFVDDLEVNVDAALEFGMAAVRFRETGQALTEIEAALAVNGG